MVRQRVLVPSFAGSNPADPARKKCPEGLFLCDEVEFLAEAGDEGFLFFNSLSRFFDESFRSLVNVAGVQHAGFEGV